MVLSIDEKSQEHNDDPKPFVWTKAADIILAKLGSIACTFRLGQCTRWSRSRQRLHDILVRNILLPDGEPP